MDPRTYLDSIKSLLATSQVVKRVSDFHERVLLSQGFFRARIILANDDFLEVAEYFSIDQGQARTLEYRYQWMDPTRQILRKRWDDAPHYSDLPNAPHHVHVSSETTVEPGHEMTVFELLEVIAKELA